ncbi:MAG TPA: acyloxyacyl hydrolase [Burkholderiales bacterium]|nr:acyloxyacyl hydrolase [Burkholderiales bacterium]
MKPRALAAATIVVAAFTCAPAHALDGLSLELGRGDDVNMGRIGVQWELKKPLLQFQNWQLGTYFDLAVGYWHQSDVNPGRNEDILDLGFTPVLRLQGNGRVGPYAEVGLGAHLLSHTTIGETRMSTAFQFGNHVGLGYRFGARSHYDLSYRFQHLSNASIKRPNGGINFHQVRLQYWF